MIKEQDNGRCPGCEFISQPLMRLYITYKGKVEMQYGIYNIHIGVGSGVVRSIISGNARALSSGTDNKDVPTLFRFVYYVYKNLTADWVLLLYGIR